MKRLYVVYWEDDRPIVESSEFKNAFLQAKEYLLNWHNHINMDIFFWSGSRWYTYECSHWDFYFIDRRGEAISSCDYDSAWIVWYALLWDTNIDQLETIRPIAKIWEIELNDIGRDVFRNFYSFKGRK